MPVFHDKRSLEQKLSHIKRSKSNPLPPKVLMVTPENFDITYAINPHMKDASGNLNKVDQKRATKQWQSLKSAYETCAVETITLPGSAGLPDMVFAANQSLPFLDNTGQVCSLMSTMASKERAAEVDFFRQWYEEHDYTVFDLTGDLQFEGEGDALWQHPYPLLWCGYGFRTNPHVYEEMSERFGFNCALVELKDPAFYHLDTCMSILSGETALICKEALTPNAIDMITSAFETVITVSRQEAIDYFCCNCHSPDGKHVILQQGSKQFVSALMSHGFIPIEIDLSEYQKSGGSVFCLKIMVY